MTEHSTLPLTEVVVFDGFDDLDAIAPLEILTAAGFPTRVVRPAGHAATVHSAHGLVMRVDAELGDSPGLVIVPGGGWLDAAAGVRDQCKGQLPDALAALHAAGTVVASVCTGAFVLGSLGLLEGRPWTTHWEDVEDLAGRLDGAGGGEGWVRWVDAGEVVTSGGLSSGIAMALHLVDRFAGRDLALRTARQIEYDWDPEAGRRT